MESRLYLFREPSNRCSEQAAKQATQQPSERAGEQAGRQADSTNWLSLSVARRAACSLARPPLGTMLKGRCSVGSSGCGGGGGGSSIVLFLPLKPRISPFPSLLLLPSALLVMLAVAVVGLRCRC